MYFIYHSLILFITITIITSCSNVLWDEVPISDRGKRLIGNKPLGRFQKN